MASKMENNDLEQSKEETKQLHEADRDSTANKINSQTKSALGNGDVHDPLSSSKAVPAEEKEDDTDYLPLPPDGGYGWMIVIASFFTNVIVDGVCFSFGIFLMEFLDYYGESKAKTSWVGSVLNGMYLSVGPIVSALANKFGCRAVAITGSLIAAASYILSTFSPSVDVLILTYGAMGGFGFGLMYLPAIVMVGYYFEKRRAFATGIAVCGSGIGAFVFAPLCRYLLDIYAWKGATWLIAGICLQGVVIGALFRPLEAKKPKSKSIMERIYEEKNARKFSDCETDNDQKHSNKVSLIENEEKNYCIQSMQNLSPSEFGDVRQQTSVTKSVDNLLLTNNGSKVVDKRLAELSKPMNRKDIFYSGSIQHLPEFKKTGGNVEEYVKSITTAPAEAADPSAKQESKTGCGAVKDTLKNMMSFSLLKNPVFLIYGISCFLCMTGFFVPFIFLPDHASQMGLSKQQGAFLISIIGIANTVARVACGFVSDLPWVDCLLLNNTALVIAGVATILCPYCFNYGLLASYSAIFGIGIAVFVSLRSILVVELLGLDNLTNAFGLVTMFQGLSAFIGAPIAGSLFDATGNYSYSFYLAGGTLAMSGLINFPLRRLARYLKKKELEKGLNDTEVPMVVT